MEYSALNESDLANVRALNALFLDSLRERSDAIELRDEEYPGIRDVLLALTALQRERLAEAPFLLFSLRERESRYWDECLSTERRRRTRDMFAAPRVADDSLSLSAAALAFLWQLASRNPYAARLVSGASVEWCERLADCELVRLLSCLATRRKFLTLRFAANRHLLSKLLGAGVSPEAEVRHAAHMAAMQSMLLQVDEPAQSSLRAAACRLPPPKQR